MTIKLLAVESADWMVCEFFFFSSSAILRPRLDFALGLGMWRGMQNFDAIVMVEELRDGI